MGEVKFTAGPWEASDPGDYGDFDGDCRVVCGDDMRIAVVHWHLGKMRVENDANAHLIAAAPCLYEAGVGIMPDGVYFDNPNVSDDLVIPLDVTMGELRAMSAALAKARGETSNA